MSRLLSENASFAFFWHAFKFSCQVTKAQGEYENVLKDFFSGQCHLLPISAD